MNSSWQDYLRTKGARLDAGWVSDFGNPAAELVAAREATIVSPLAHLGVIECAGEDAKVFLHNQLTSDINHLAPDAAQHSAWCTAKGRMQASFLIYRNGADYRAILASDLLPAIRNDLQKYVLRSKVRIADLSVSQAILGVSGPKAESAIASANLPLPPNSLETRAFDQGMVIRLETNRFLLVLACEAAADIWAKLSSSARPAGTPVWQWLDIQAGLPLISKATRESFVPQMANFDKIGGVSFHKGCYPGQEVVARTQYLGKVKRHLYHIHADTVFTAGTAIYSPDNSENLFGMVCNSAPAPGGGFDGLAVIQESIVEGRVLLFDAAGQTGVLISGISTVGD